MPARASSASCRGAAAVADESPSSRRRGRCCSEPAMGAQGSAQSPGEVGLGGSCCGPRARPEPGSTCPERSGAGRRGGAGRGAAGREEPSSLQRGGERGRPGHRLPPPRGITQQPPARASCSLRDAGSRGHRSRIRFRVSLTLRSRGRSGLLPRFLQPPCAHGSTHSALRPAVPGRRAEPARKHGGLEARTLTRSSGLSGKQERASGFEKGTESSAWVAARARVAGDQQAEASARRFWP